MTIEEDVARGLDEGETNTAGIKFIGIQIILLALHARRLADKVVDSQDENDKFSVRAGSGHMAVRKLDEYEIDFADTRRFTVVRWKDIATATEQRLSPSDQTIAAAYQSSEGLAEEIELRLEDLSSTPIMKRQLGKIQPLPRVLAVLIGIFTKLVVPFNTDFDILWGLIYINLKLSYTSTIRLKRVTDSLFKMKRVVELFNSCLGTCHRVDEARIAIVDFLDPLLGTLTDLNEYLHESSSDKHAEDSWPDLNESINNELWTMDQTVKHVNELTSYSQASLNLEVKNLTLKHALTPENEEPGRFPTQILPFRQNQRFYGRQAELNRILGYLSPKGEQSLRTYTIYGKRGIGKTAIALQFAYTNISTFDAIFWIQCETSVAGRQSVSEVAVALNIPGADRDGRHEENLIEVHNWLKRTKKKWLLIFDNVENESILRQYWPRFTSGAILITTRSHYNFIKDICRKGDTVKRFNSQENWELLLEFLGDVWKQADTEHKISHTEVAAAKAMLEQFEGLALAIEQAAVLIKDERVGGITIAKTYDIFKERVRSFPERHSKPRSTAERSLDALWDMIFQSLTPNARILIGVFAWLSPDAIPKQLFHPRDQTALNGPLSFCKFTKYVDSNSRASLSSIITSSPELVKVIDELCERDLIRKDSNIFSVHRVVQEAVNYHSIQDLQTSYDAACRLVFQQFPRRANINDSLVKAWCRCQMYIPHAVSLSKKFADHSKLKVLKGSLEFIQLLGNAGWYLQELGDFDTCERLVRTALIACDDKTSLLYVDLRTTAGCRYYELNRLSDCRKAWVESLRVREGWLLYDYLGIAALYNNLGNLELADGNINLAMDYYHRAQLIWVAGEDDTAEQLAVTYLCIGRVHKLRHEFKEAMRYTELSEELVLRTTGDTIGFIVHVHYGYGNIYFRQNRWDLAWRSYDACLKIALASMPLHPITAAVWYSLACVEFSRGNTESARFNLDKAKVIAMLRSPNRTDGPTARILWMTAVVLESDVTAKYADEAKGLRKNAAMARQALLASGEGGTIPFVDETENRNIEEDDYDALIPLFYR